MCVKQVFVNQTAWDDAVIGALGFDAVRFPHSAYVYKDSFARVERTATHASRSKPDRGVVTLNFRIHNADDVTALTYIDTVMFAGRPTTQ